MAAQRRKLDETTKEIFETMKKKRAVRKKNPYIQDEAIEDKSNKNQISDDDDDNEEFIDSHDDEDDEYEIEIIPEQKKKRLTVPVDKIITKDSNLSNKSNDKTKQLSFQNKAGPSTPYEKETDDDDDLEEVDMIPKAIHHEKTNTAPASSKATKARQEINNSDAPLDLKNLDIPTPEGKPKIILDKRYMNMAENKIKRDALYRGTNMLWNAFPIFQLAKEKFFGVRMSIAAGESKFYFWKGSATDDVDAPHVHCLSEKAYSQLTFHGGRQFIEWAYAIDHYKYKHEKRLLKKGEKEPEAPLDVTLDMTAAGSYTLATFKYKTGAGGGIAVYFNPDAANEEAEKPTIAYNPAQFYFLIKVCAPVVNTCIKAAGAMMATIKDAEEIGENIPEVAADFWRQ